MHALSAGVALLSLAASTMASRAPKPPPPPPRKAAAPATAAGSRPPPPPPPPLASSRKTTRRENNSGKHRRSSSVKGGRRQSSTRGSRPRAPAFDDEADDLPGVMPPMPTLPKLAGRWRNLGNESQVVEIHVYADESFNFRRTFGHYELWNAVPGSCFREQYAGMTNTVALNFSEIGLIVDYVLEFDPETYERYSSAVLQTDFVALFGAKQISFGSAENSDVSEPVVFGLGGKATNVEAPATSRLVPADC